MEYTTLGRTGLRVSVMGLGGGGPSRVGLRTGRSEAESIAIIRQALDAGINFIDTAESYGTEAFVGQALRNIDRSQVVLSTKKSTWNNTTPQDVRKSVEESLQRLRTDYIDVYHLHAVMLEEYDLLFAELLPVLQDLRQEGKIRFIGITERFHADPAHKMIQRALQDDVWDVMMIGFNLLNQSARYLVFPTTQERNIGILVMFAVRKALSRPERLHEVIQELLKNGQLDSADLNISNPFDFLTHPGGTENLVDAAYRFCRDEPGTHVILSGTGNPEHLQHNLESFGCPPLPAEDVARLRHIFRHVDSVSGQ